jgi:hypothetical protein
MLLSGPPSVLIFFEPGVEVNPVVDAAPAELDARDAQLGKERDADAKIGCGLLPGEAANGRAGQRCLCTLARLHKSLSTRRIHSNRAHLDE